MDRTAALYAAMATVYSLLGLTSLIRSLPLRAGADVPPSRARSVNIGSLAIGGGALIAAIWGGLVALSADSAAADSVGLLQMTGWFTTLMLIERQFNGRPVGLGLQLRLAVLVIGLLSTALLAGAGSSMPLFDEFGVDVRFILAVSTLVLIENIYRNAAAAARWHLNLPCIAIAGMSVYTLLLYGDAVLHRQLSDGLVNGRAVAWMMLAPLLLAGTARQRRWRRPLALSRTAAFYSTSLVLSGAFLLGLGAAGEVFRSYGSGWGTVAETALIFIGLVTIAVFLTSGSARSYIRILVLDHFYARRYDYHREWMRCLATLAAPMEGVLEQRVIRVLADTVDSPAGVLFLRDGPGLSTAFTLAGVWNWPEAELVLAADSGFVEALRSAGGILQISKGGIVPWTAKFPDPWLAIGLPGTPPEVLLGIVCVAPPRAAFAPDREVFDLLGVVSREVSLVLAERQAAEALANARRFEEAGKRFAFVAHDIKNVSSQLALLLANASDHMDNPEFRQDMLATLRASVDKINVMLARLKAPQAGAAPALVPGERLAALAASAQKGASVPVVFETDDGEGAVAVETSVFDAVIGHLLDNAIEASTAGAPVRLALWHEAEQIVIEIRDQGVGMSAAFIRDTLFRPFASSKPKGFGLGAFQARELVRAAGGEVAVESVPGEGTAMRITLPRLRMPALTPATGA